MNAVNDLNEKTASDQDTEKSNAERENLRKRSVALGAIATVLMATGFIVAFELYEFFGIDGGGGVEASKRNFFFAATLIVLSILLFMRAARLRNEYYFGISSKGWSGMPTDKDLGEAFKRVKNSMNEDRDAELVELRHELKELRSQLKENSQADQNGNPVPETSRRKRGEDQ